MMGNSWPELWFGFWLLMAASQTRVAGLSLNLWDGLDGLFAITVDHSPDPTTLTTTASAAQPGPQLASPLHRDQPQEQTKAEVARNLRAHLQLKNLTITCPELGNYTFTNRPPFDVLGIPECEDKVQPQMRLYLPAVSGVSGKGGNSTCDLEPRNLPNPNTTACFEELNKRGDIGKVVLLVHGFLNSFSTDWLHQMQAKVQQVDPSTAVMVIIVPYRCFEPQFQPSSNVSYDLLQIVGWGRGLADLFSYWRAAGNAR